MIAGHRVKKSTQYLRDVEHSEIHDIGPGWTGFEQLVDAFKKRI